MSLRQSGTQKVTAFVNSIVGLITAHNSDSNAHSTEMAKKISKIDDASKVLLADGSNVSLSTFANVSHTHGNINNNGAIGTVANKPIITTTSGKLTTGSFGTTSGTFCQGNDSRLSNARTPTAHTHTISEISDFPSTMPPTTHTHDYDTDSILTIPIGTGEAQYLQLNLDTGLGIYAKWVGTFSISNVNTWTDVVNFDTVLQTNDIPFTISVLGTSWTSNILNGANGTLYGRLSGNHFSVYSSSSTGTVIHVPFTVPFFYRVNEATG